MSEFGGNEAGSSEIGGDSSTAASDVNEVETNAEASESEIDGELSNEIDDVYDSYMKEGESKSYDSDLSETQEVKEAEIDEIPPDELKSDLDDKYELYINEKELSLFKKGGKQIDSTKTSLDDLDSEADNKYNHYIGEGVEIANQEQNDNAESSSENIKCRNENLDGQVHPETGIPFERKQVEVDGQKYEVVVPEFESSYDAQLPKDMYDASDREQFKECNTQLKREITSNKDLREQFDEEQLDQIENGDTPDGYTWHHDAEAGKMQLVDTETHQKTGHTGGRSIWGGGAENR